VNEHSNLTHSVNTHGPGGWRIKNPVHRLHLQEVVPGTQGAQLGAAPGLGALTHGFRVGAGDAASLLGNFQVVGVAQPVSNGPPRAVKQNLINFSGGEAQPASRAHAGVNVPEEGGHQFPQMGAHLRFGQVGAQQADAAVDVKAHAARGDDTFPIHQRSGHPADGEPIPPVNVGHGQGVTHDAGQEGHVGHLLQALFVGNGLQ
jgi:hypothetical protein